MANKNHPSRKTRQRMVAAARNMGVPETVPDDPRGIWRIGLFLIRFLAYFFPSHRQLGEYLILSFCLGATAGAIAVITGAVVYRFLGE